MANAREELQKTTEGPFISICSSLSQTDFEKQCECKAKQIMEREKVQDLM